jgi:hypothetical protein
LTPELDRARQEELGIILADCRLAPQGDVIGGFPRFSSPAKEDCLE